MTNAPRYSPCFRCSSLLNKAETSNERKIQRQQRYIDFFKEEKKFTLGTHGNSKSILKSINMSDPKEIELMFSGEVIEVQVGKNNGEFKFILHVFRDDEPIHYILLKTPFNDYPTLINVYNPTEGMDFKWSKDGKKRLYVNSMRSCCPHPLDSKENYNKEHHGVQHRNYEYQEKDAN